MQKPLVSVLMSAYNAERYLAAAVRSIIRQTYKEWELLIINDGSSDNTAMILDNFVRQDSRIRVLHQKNQGLTASLNQLITIASGQFTARMDADDVSYPSRLEKQVEYLLRHPHIGLVTCWTHAVDQNGGARFCVCYPDDHRILEFFFQKGINPIFHASVMFRSQLVQQLELPYRFRYSQDMDLWLRLLPITQFGVIQDLLLASRDHDGRLSAHNQAMRARLREYIFELHTRRQSGEEEGDWRSVELSILSQINTNVDSETARAINAFITGKNLLLDGKSMRAARKELLIAMRLPRLIPKVLLRLPLTFLPAFATRFLLWKVRRRLVPLAQYYRPLQDVVTIENQLLMDKFWQEIHKDGLN